MPNMKILNESQLSAGNGRQCQSILAEAFFPAAESIAFAAVAGMFLSVFSRTAAGEPLLHGTRFVHAFIGGEDFPCFATQ
jgi:hypothetical protein